MRFEYYSAELDAEPKLSVDGTVPNSIHFSHWQGNNTPASVKADTSTEIALNLAGSANRRELTQGIELVTNNHFDTDGVLSVWTVFMGEPALDMREQLIAAAEAGDFSEFTNENAVRASIVIQGSDQPVPAEEAGSPLARYLAGENVTDEGRAYSLVLPEVARVLTRTNDYEPLWRAAWERIAAALESFARGSSRVEDVNGRRGLPVSERESFARGSSRVEELADANLSVITIDPEVFSPNGFNPTRHAAPYTAISRHARGQLFLIATEMHGGWSYRIDYPYYSWAETIVRPRIRRHDFTTLIARLNELERDSGGRWKPDTSEMTSAVKFLDQSGTLCASSLAPEKVAEEVLRAHRDEKETSVAGAQHG